MSDPGSTERPVLFSQLAAHAHGAGTATPPNPPTAAEAMAMYSVTAQLVELQLLQGGGTDRSERDTAIARDLLLGTHRILTSALAHVEAHDALEHRPSLRLVGGGGTAQTRRSRPRRYFA